MEGNIQLLSNISSPHCEIQVNVYLCAKYYYYTGLLYTLGTPFICVPYAHTWSTDPGYLFFSSHFSAFSAVLSGFFINF